MIIYSRKRERIRMREKEIEKVGEKVIFRFLSQIAEKED
jgi:hypothetical protein